MNQIHEKDWAEDYWGAHSGACSSWGVIKDDVVDDIEDSDNENAFNILGTGGQCPPVTPPS